jgi:hypothetical protein
MSRFVSGFEKEEERFIEKAYLAESAVPVIMTRYVADKVASRGDVYLITNSEKNGSRIIFAPGVIAFIMFIKKKITDDKAADGVTAAFINYFTGRIKGAYRDGNDLLICGKKAMGMSVIYNGDMAMVRFVLTLRVEKVKVFFSERDFDGCKYKGITGVCDETVIDERDARAMVIRFIDYALEWRPENASE